MIFILEQISINHMCSYIAISLGMTPFYLRKEQHRVTPCPYQCKLFQWFYWGSIILFSVGELLRFGIPMMLVLVAGYPICVGGGTTFVDTYLPLASFPKLAGRKRQILFWSWECIYWHQCQTKLISEGQPYLHGLYIIGSSLYVRKFVEGKVKIWSSDVIHLLRVNHSCLFSFLLCQ